MNIWKSKDSLTLQGITILATQHNVFVFHDRSRPVAEFKFWKCSYEEWLGGIME